MGDEKVVLIFDLSLSGFSDKRELGPGVYEVASQTPTSGKEWARGSLNKVWMSDSKTVISRVLAWAVSSTLILEELNVLPGGGARGTIDIEFDNGARLTGIVSVDVCI